MSTYQSISFSTDLDFIWPIALNGGQNASYVIDDFNDLSADTANLNVIFPTLTGASIGVGRSFIIHNNGVNSFTVQTTTDPSTGTVTDLKLIKSGEIFYFVLIDASTSDGSWRIVPWGAGTSSITSISVKSPGGALSITGSPVVAPGGTVNIDFIAALATLKNITSDGWVYYNALPSPKFGTFVPQAGTNIDIVNPAVTGGLPGFSVASSPSFTNVSVSALSLEGNEISAINTVVGGGKILINAVNGVILNNVLTIVTNPLVSSYQSILQGNSVITGDLEVDGAIVNDFVAQAWATFTDNGTTIQTFLSKNVASITGGSGTYSINFTTPMQTSNYAAFTSLVSGGLAVSAEVDSKSNASIVVSTVDASGQLVIPSKQVSIVVFSDV